jgi:hypothetical protein
MIKTFKNQQIYYWLWSVKELLSVSSLKTFVSIIIRVKNVIKCHFSSIFVKINQCWVYYSSTSYKNIIYNHSAKNFVFADFQIPFDVFISCAFDQKKIFFEFQWKRMIEALEIIII